MIIDYISNADQYKQVSDFAKSAFAYAKSCTSDMVDGRYDINDGMFALIMSGETTAIEEGLFETHEKYIDLQYVIEGEELLEVDDISSLLLKIPYDVEKDASFYEGTGQVLHIRNGMFYIMFPNDAHKGCKHIDKPTRYKKVVIKIPAQQSEK